MNNALKKIEAALQELELADIEAIKEMCDEEIARREDSEMNNDKCEVSQINAIEEQDWVLSHNQ